MSEAGSCTRRAGSSLFEILVFFSLLVSVVLFLKYYIKVSFILMTSVFGVSLNFAPEASATHISPLEKHVMI